jgi:uncharacterized membrane protein
MEKIGRSHPADGNEEKLAKGLGWFSIGLGLAEVIAPGGVARLIGVENRPGTRTLLRAYGIREMAAGVGILSLSQPTGWVWSRVAGDMLDLASLGSAMASGGTNRKRLTTATIAVAGVTALDVVCGQKLSRTSPNGWTGRNGHFKAKKTIIISRSPEEVYDFWHDLSNLPSFMNHLESVQVTGDRRSHWKAKAPDGSKIEWDAETIGDERGDHISWRSVEGSDIHTFGTVRFERAPGNRGTIVKVEFEYVPTGGSMSAMLAKLVGSGPEQLLEADLRALKQILETGAIVRSDSSIHTGMHPAQPPETVPAGVGSTSLSPNLVSF